MSYVIAAVVIIGGISLLNLMLGMGIIRRLREHQELLSKATSGEADTGMLHAGDVIAEFSARTIDGRQINLADLSTDGVVAFFSPSCKPCHELLPEFIAHAASIRGGREEVLAVVVGTLAEATDMIAELAPVARIVTAQRTDQIVAAFATTSFPTLYLVGADGRIASSGHTVSALPSLVAA